MTGTDWFTPTYQPDETCEVSFELKPLDFWGFYELQASLGEDFIPSRRGIEQAAQLIVGWKGIKENGAEVPFSPGYIKALFKGQPSMAWTLWLSQIAGHKYGKAILSETERKN
jgi:hypothetical protein